MKIEFYSYTRGEQPDYRDFCLPNNIGKDFISVLQNMVRPILECDLDNPRWVLYKKHNVVAWGLCCKNETLSNSCNVDIKGRSVKGFFALIFSDIEEDNFWIPSFDINIFKNFYEEEIAPYWYCQEGDIHYSHKHSVDGIHIDKIFAKNNEYSEELNSNIFQCKSLGRMDKKEVIAAAMTFPEISLLIDNEDFVEATGKKAPFMNCLSSSVSSKTVKVKRICPQCHKYVDEFTENGICVKCDNDNNINITTNDIDIMNQHDISLQDKENLEKLKKTLRDSELSVKELENKLKKEKLANKILLAICSVFLLIIAYLWHNKTGEGSVSDNKEVVKDSTVISKEKTYRLEVYPKTIEEQSTGRDSIVITWKDNAPKVKATFADKNDWVKEVSKNDNSIVVRVEKNETGKEREAIVEFVLDGQKEKVNIKQAAH